MTTTYSPACQKDERKELDIRDVEIFFNAVDNIFDGCYRPHSDFDATFLSREMNRLYRGRRTISPVEVGSLMKHLKNQRLTRNDFE